MLQQKTVRPDSKGRINLGNLSKGVSGFKVGVDKQQRIILDPLVEISAREQWLFNNPTLLRQVQKGIQDAAQGKVVERDFSGYLNDEAE